MLPTLLILLYALAGFLIYHANAPSTEWLSSELDELEDDLQHVSLADLAFLKLRLNKAEAQAKEAEKDLLTALRNRLEALEAYLKVKE